MRKSAGIWLLGTTGLVVVLMAFFNVRIGFGAQAADCIDAHMSLVQYTTTTVIPRGSYAVFIAPTAMGSQFAGHLVIKKVGAVAGDHVVITNNLLYINGREIGPLDVADKAAKRLGVSVASFAKDEIVPKGKLFMIGTKPRTFDSRYWGDVTVGSVVGKAYPLL